MSKERDRRTHTHRAWMAIEYAYFPIRMKQA